MASSALAMVVGARPSPCNVERINAQGLLRQRGRRSCRLGGPGLCHVACRSDRAIVNASKMAVHSSGPTVLNIPHSRDVGRDEDSHVCSALKDDSASPVTPAAPASSSNKSLFCPACEGNGAVVCPQCAGGGVNLKDHFQGMFKTGSLCWLCRGKKDTLCGNCNGAGFVGGWMSTADE